MARFILIHGAWHDARAWERVVPVLLARGHSVETPDLPGNGRDATPAREVSLATYVDHIERILVAKPDPAILVGHSMAGIVLSSVAERLPERLAALVYVAAFMLPTGLSMVRFYELYGEPWMKGARVHLQQSADGSYSTMPQAAARQVFFNCCDDQTAAAASAHLGPMPSQPRRDAVEITAARWGRLPRFYGRTLRDETVFPQLQDRMLALSPGTATHDFDTDHSPFYSTTDEFNDWLDGIARSKTAGTQIPS
ncbi:MAG: alpha/beta fold hydrolase [Pseudomonadota bacterium]